MIIASNIADSLTIVVKTHDRPKALRRFLISVEKYLSNVKIIVVDDGKEAFNNDLIPISLRNRLTYVRTDYDVGLSAGRNIGVAKVCTQYIFLADDDFELTCNSKIISALSELKSTDADIMALRLMDYGLCDRKFYGTYAYKDGNLIRKIGVPRYVEDNVCYYDFVLNCFIAKTEFLLNNTWDDDIKIGYEHDDFFIRASTCQGAKITYNRKFIVYHFPQADTAYNENRVERLKEYYSTFSKKHNLKIVSNNGNVFSLIDKFLLKAIQIFKKLAKLIAA